MSKDITWAALIPLIGGHPLGAEKATGKPPEFVASYTGFWANDSQYMNYQNNTLGRSIPYINLTETPDFKQKVNIVVATPPCAGLSQLNTGKSPEAKGAGCHKNEWMYISAQDAIEKFDCDVYLCENAPALYTNKGKPVADKLFEIAKKFGYSLTLYKTSTMYHGIPQNRDRTFAIMWKSDTAPVMNWYREARKDFAPFLKEVKSKDLHQDIVINPKVASEPYYQFLKAKYGKDPRLVMIEANVVTAFTVVQRRGLLQEANAWFKANGNENGIKYSDHAMKKFAQGLGVWDGSTHVFSDVMNAVIGRNMNDTIHPTEDRSLTIREALHLMGFPKEFELLGGRAKANMIAQNVPVCTAACMVKEAIKFINGELTDSGLSFCKQNNHSQTFDTKLEMEYNDLEEFFALKGKVNVRV